MTLVRTVLKRLIFTKAVSSGNAELTEETATGNPAIFVTDVKRPFKQCLCTFAPTQAGTGEPTPENIRPITGYTGLTVYRSGEDVENPSVFQINWQTDAGTVNGGSVDLISGVLTVEWVQKILDENTPLELPSGNQQRPYFVAEGWEKFGDVVDDTAISDQYVVNTSLSLDNTDIGFRIWNRSASNAVRFIIRPYGWQDMKTVELFHAYLAVHPIQIVYRLANPRTYNINPVLIRSLLGENNVWSIANENVTVKYMKKADG